MFIFGNYAIRFLLWIVAFLLIPFYFAGSAFNFIKNNQPQDCINFNILFLYVNSLQNNQANLYNRQVKWPFFIFNIFLHTLWTLMVIFLQNPGWYLRRRIRTWQDKKKEASITIIMQIFWWIVKCISII